MRMFRLFFFHIRKQIISRGKNNFRIFVTNLYGNFLFKCSAIEVYNFIQKLTINIPVTGIIQIAVRNNMKSFEFVLSN